jgi:hypothetical protein
VRNKPLTKEIEVNKHRFKIEIYPTLVSWEIFPYDYNAALYAFSNKDKLNKIIEEEYVYEPKK